MLFTQQALCGCVLFDLKFKQLLTMLSMFHEFDIGEIITTRRTFCLALTPFEKKRKVRT